MTTSGCHDGTCIVVRNALSGPRRIIRVKEGLGITGTILDGTLEELQVIRGDREDRVRSDVPFDSLLIFLYGQKRK